MFYKFMFYITVIVHKTLASVLGLLRTNWKYLSHLYVSLSFCIKSLQILFILYLQQIALTAGLVTSATSYWCTSADLSSTALFYCSLFMLR